MLTFLVHKGIPFKVESQLSTSTILTGRSEEIDKVSAKRRKFVEHGPITSEVPID